MADSRKGPKGGGSDGERPDVPLDIPPLDMKNADVADIEYPTAEQQQRNGGAHPERYPHYVPAQLAPRLGAIACA